MNVFQVIKDVAPDISTAGNAAIVIGFIAVLRSMNSMDKHLLAMQKNMAEWGKTLNKQHICPLLQHSGSKEEKKHG